MGRAEVLVRLQGQMSRALEVDESAIQEATRLVDDLDADSLDLLELILALKNEFRIDVHDGEVKQLLSDLARFLPEQVGSGPELTDAELAEVSRRMTVGNIVDFIVARSVGA